MEKSFYWKDLTGDGLMKEPPPFGPHYDESKLNNWGQGYASEAEAITDYEYMKKIHGFSVPSSLVLISEYSCKT